MLLMLFEPLLKRLLREPERGAASLTQFDKGQALLAHQVMQAGPADAKQGHHLLVFE